MKDNIIISEEIDKEIANAYSVDGVSIMRICLKYKIGKLKVKAILQKYNIETRNHGGSKPKHHFLINDYSIPKYKEKEGYHYVAVSKINGKKFYDYQNVSGCLINHIKKMLDIDVPSVYDRQLYYKTTGNYWHEQWFDIVLEKNQAPQQTKQCPYCGWETIDINNRSGVFEQHLKQKHCMTVEEHLKNHPEDKRYFTSQVVSTRRKIHEYDEDKFVVCQICGKKLARIDWKHLDKHGITLSEYKQRYGIDSTLSKEYKDTLHDISILGNIALENCQVKYASKAEIEIKEFIHSLGIECDKNRTVLNGKELDIFIPSFNLAIEFNGNLWHSERFGHKDKNYHLNKLNECNAQGINLIQICEDEYALHKEIVLSKLKHILQMGRLSKPNIMGRKCSVKEINQDEASIFLNENSLEGAILSTIYIGAFHNGELIGIAAFLQENDSEWNMTCLSTSIQYRCQGVASKMLNHFIKTYKPSLIKSFGDRRWVINASNNLYTKLGFALRKIIEPDYKLYSTKVDRFKRFDKSEFQDEKLMEELKLDKIWDCGKFEYIWENRN